MSRDKRAAMRLNGVFQAIASGLQSDRERYFRLITDDWAERDGISRCSDLP